MRCNRKIKINVEVQKCEENSFFKNQPLSTLKKTHLSRLFNSLFDKRKAFGIICLSDKGGDVGKSVVTPPERLPFVQPREYWNVCPWIWFRLRHAKVVTKKINLNIFAALKFTLLLSLCALSLHKNHGTNDRILRDAKVLYILRRSREEILICVRGTRFTSYQIKVMCMQIGYLITLSLSTHTHTYQFRVIVKAERNKRIIFNTNWLRFWNWYSIVLMVVLLLWVDNLSESF